MDRDLDATTPDDELYTAHRAALNRPPHAAAGSAGMWENGPVDW
jgi:hypothetical protein